MLTDLRRAAVALVAFTVLVGLAYPLLMFGVGQVAFGGGAEGSLVRGTNGQVVGSSLIGQAFDAPEYFWGRPSAAGDGYDAGASGASNRGRPPRRWPTRCRSGSTPCSRPPGRDGRRHPGRAGDRLRLRARPRHLAGRGRVPGRAGGRRPPARPGQVRELVRDHTQGRDLGFLGEPRVNVPSSTWPSILSSANDRAGDCCADERRRGRLKVFLGAAAGVGKTYAMLGEARDLKAAGVDVVIGYLESHGRRATEDRAAGLRSPRAASPGSRAGRSPRWTPTGCWSGCPSSAWSTSWPTATTPGAHPKRWQDVEELLDAGVDVLTTVNIQHLESLNDKVFELTGVRVRETFPDRLLHEADEVVLTDLPPDALRERIAQGRVYAARQGGPALLNFFRFDNLTALRALALREVAEQEERHLLGPELAGAARQAVGERVMVCIDGRPDSSELVRRAARMARRGGGPLYVLHVEPADEREPDGVHQAVEAAEELGRQLGATVLRRTGDVAQDGGRGGRRAGRQPDRARRVAPPALEGAGRPVDHRPHPARDRRGRRPHHRRPCREVRWPATLEASRSTARARSGRSPGSRPASWSGSRCGPCGSRPGWRTWWSST